MLLNWLLSALTIGITAYLTPGVELTFLASFIVALVLGLINATIKPLLLILTLPITIVTLGLFTLVINGFVIELTSWIVPGFRIANFWYAILFAIVLSIVQVGIFLFRPQNK